MRNFFKNNKPKGAAFFLAMLLFVSAVLIFPVPTGAAASVRWYNGEMETNISVEAGAKFYIGDFVRILSNGTTTTASLMGASYTSQNSKIASINGKGYLKAKKTGTADITVSCQGKTLVCHLTVEKKGTFVQSEAVKELKAAAKKLAKGMPKRLTAAKGSNLKKKRDEYLISYGMNSAHLLAYDGFLYQNERPAPDTVDDSRSEKLAVPEAGRYLTAEALLREFMLANNPVSTDSRKTMRISSVSVNKKKTKFTVTLAGKLSAEQILAAQLAFPKENGSSMGKTKANIMLSIYDETAQKHYTGRILLKKGSRRLEVEPMNYVYGGYKSIELIKGHVYWLGSKMNWANGTKVTVK